MTGAVARLTAALGDHYRLERELGRGGMATVYLAEDLKHHRRVAIKVLRDELTAALGPERFLREIDTTANLRHPHILPLYDSGETAGLLFYVMPYVEGESLRDRLGREKQLPVEEALRITREIADALAFAHGRGVLHRDVKPENILLESGHAVLADFGIARAITAAGGDTLTGAGVTIGTPAYMSPEQAAGNKDLDGRSDLYSLACVLYEMLAGQPPFSGPTVESVVRQHIVAEPRAVTQLRPSVPAEVASALSRSLAKAPADRFGGLGQMMDALQAGARKEAPPRSRAGRRVAAGVAAALLLGIAAAAIRMRSPRPEAVELGRATQVTMDPGVELDPGLSPDAKFLAYTGPRGVLAVRQVENGVPLTVVRGGDGAGRWPAWLPDGQRLGFVSPRGIEIVSALGGVPRLLVPGAGAARGVTAAPDGRSIAYTVRDSILVVPVEGGTPRLITVGRELHSPAWSTDGRWIAYVSGNIQYVRASDLGNIAFSSIWVVPAGGGTPVEVVGAQSLNVSPAWLSARSLLFVSNRDGGRDVYRVDLDPSGRQAHDPVRFTTGLNAYGVSISSDGSALAYSAFAETSNAWRLPVPGARAASASEATAVTLGTQTIENLDVSFDSRWIAFGSYRSGVGQLYRMRLGTPGAEPQQLTTDAAGSYWTAWSPDGREIAFHRFSGERRVSHVMSAEGGTATPVSNDRDDVRSPEWSPDGRQLLLLANWATKPELRIVTRGADGRWSPERPFPIVIDGDTISAGIAAWSPDGRWVACGCGPGGIVIAPTAGGPARRLPSPFSTAGWAFPQWSADGRTVFHLAEDSGRVGAVIAVPVSGAPPRVAVRFDDPTRPWHRYSFRIRGDQMYFTLGEQESDVWVAELHRR